MRQEDNGRSRIIAAALAVLSIASVADAAEPAGAAARLLNVGYWQTVRLGDVDLAAADAKIAPIVLAGARNGAFSGCAVLASGSALRGVKARAGDLAGDGATLAAAHVQVRFAAPAAPETGWLPKQRFDALLDAAPAEVRAVEVQETKVFKPAHPGIVALLPVWVTVHVPRDAAPGRYRGAVTVECTGAGPFQLPVEMAVSALVLPDPQAFTVDNLAMTSPDQEAKYYHVPMWSDRHFQLMARTLALMQEVGSRQAVVNLVNRYPSQDNTDTMVKWVRQADGTFSNDFSVFDRYLDMVQTTLGKPFPLRLNMWANKHRQDPTLPVLAVDPATGKTESMAQPEYGSPEARAFWKPVLDGIRQRVEKRHWFDVTGVNWIQYAGGPTPDVVSMFQSIWPDGKWTHHSHGRAYSFPSEQKGVSMPVMCSMSVWNEGSLAAYEKWDGKTPGPRAFRAGPKSNLSRPGVSVCGHARNRYYDHSPLLTVRFLNEEMLMRDQHGLDPIGADYWPVPDARGRLEPGQWADYCMGPGNCTKALLAPGPDGALPTERFEALREGVQIAETMLFLQRALDGNKISGALADKVNRLLDERAFAWITAAKAREAEHKSKTARNSLISAEAWGSLDLDLIAKGVQERDAALYAVAGEVAQAMLGNASTSAKQ
jgi:hypothetical protein